MSEVRWTDEELEGRAALIVRGEGLRDGGGTASAVTRSLYVEIARALGRPRDVDRAVLEVLISGDLELMRLCEEAQALRNLFVGFERHVLSFSRVELETDLWRWLHEHDHNTWRELERRLEG